MSPNLVEKLVSEDVWGYQVPFAPKLAVTGQSEKAFSSYALREDYADVIFHVGDQKFPAPKVILAAESDVFAALFTHSMEESKTNCVVAEDINSDIFAEMLRFIYLGVVSSAFSVDLLLVADKHNLPELIRMCLPYSVCMEKTFKEIIKLYMVASVR